MDIFDWSTTAASNGFAAPNGFPEGMNYSDVNDSAREIMAVLARWYADTNGSLVTAGAGNAYTLTSNRTVTSYVDGLEFAFRSDRANTGAMTLNVSGVGATSVTYRDGTAIGSGDIRANANYRVIYNATSAKWILDDQAATESNRGVVELASDAEAIAGTDTARALTPSNLAGSGVLWSGKRFESSEQTITNGTTLTLPHSLGSAPKVVECFIVCKTAEHGYAVGDVATVEGMFVQALNDRGVQVSYNATNVYLTVAINGIDVGRRGGGTVGGAQSITSSNWRLVVRAYA